MIQLINNLNLEQETGLKYIMNQKAGLKYIMNQKEGMLIVTLDLKCS